MTRVELCNDFRGVEPDYLKARGITLLTVDVENVLTDWQVPEILPGMAEHMEEIMAVGDLRVAMLSNCMDLFFLRKVAKQLPGNIPHINPTFAWGLRPKGFRPKSCSTMFEFALKRFETKASDAAHVDDQFKAWLGARAAGFDTFFWTKPGGEHQHPGVKALRPIEMGIIRPTIGVANSLTSKF